jgi:2,3-dihydroxy-p-cumate/2,3-dihydroxybenzoate 3,4-dioxygenase
MINLHDIRYARLGTQDLDGAVKFATGIVGLQLVAREGNTAYFRSDKTTVCGDTRDHTLVYFEGDPSDQTIGLELNDPDDLNAVGAALEQAGRAVHFGTREECDSRRTRAFIASADPSGNKLARPYNSGTRFFPTRKRGDHKFQPRCLVQHRHQARHRILDPVGQCAGV